MESGECKEVQSGMRVEGRAGVKEVETGGVAVASGVRKR